MVFGLHSLDWNAPRENLAEHVQRIRFAASLAVSTGQRQGSICKSIRFVQVSSLQFRVRKADAANRLIVNYLCRNGKFQRLSQ